MNDLIKWGADFLVSSWNSQQQGFVAVLGNNSLDFNYYGPVEEYDRYVDRPAFYINAQNPGGCAFAYFFRGGEWAVRHVWKAPGGVGSLASRNKLRQNLWICAAAEGCLGTSRAMTGGCQSKKRRETRSEY